MRRAVFSLVSVVLLMAATATAQGEYTWIENSELKVRFKLHNKLQAIPLKVGDINPHQKMRFEPRSDGDYIYGRLGTYEWYLDVFEFPKNVDLSDPEVKAGDGPESTGTKKAIQDAMVRKNMAPDFQTWVTEKDPKIQDRAFAIKGTPNKASGKSPAYTWWEYSDTQETRGDQTLSWFHCAAVYDFPDKQVAIVASVPVMDKKGAKPEAKHYKWQKTMTLSLESIATDDDGMSTSVEKKEEFANTPERKAELTKAKANIANLPGWDYFTSPNYIVLWAWNPDKPGMRAGQYKFTRKVVSALEETRELYLKDYPPHDKMSQPYSILRVCDDHESFMKYGSSQWGVVGWFSPGSKELVIFEDAKHIYGKLDAIEVAAHEGWHQYADSYFGGQNDFELHRWFDEGTGEFYGALHKKGGQWVTETLQSRKPEITQFIARKTYVPWREIVSWNKDKFYGEKATQYYAQGYTMIEFLRRGEKAMGSKFDPRWGQALDIYRTTMLETKNQKTAVEKAFEGVDWDKLEACWVEYVKKKML
jgi:hypothetical protein